MMDTFTEKSNIIFTTRYQALKKVTIILLPVTGPFKKVTINPLLVTQLWKKRRLFSYSLLGTEKK